MKPMTPEPWLRGTHREINAVQRQIIHALELTAEDVARWCGPLTDAEFDARPHGLEPVAFHLRHIARSLDRLLSYAEGMQLDGTQLAALQTEMEPNATHDAVLLELNEALARSTRRVLALTPQHYSASRGVGRGQLPSTVGGLLVHCAEHTQRHTGQAITTAKLLLAMRTKRVGTRAKAPYTSSNFDVI
jgi:uncharacterized damage-inducible protein DinB